jgi:hypothetical protein
MVIYTLYCALDNTGMSCETNHSFLLPGHTICQMRGTWSSRDKIRKKRVAKYARVKQTFIVVEMKTPYY